MSEGSVTIKANTHVDSMPLVRDEFRNKYVA